MHSSMRNPYPNYAATAAEVRKVFAYAPTLHRLMRRMPDNAAKPCGPIRGDAWVMWNGRRWPLLLLIWMCTRVGWPRGKVIRLWPELNRADNLVEKGLPDVP